MGWILIIISILLIAIVAYVKRNQNNKSDYDIYKYPQTSYDYPAQNAIKGHQGEASIAMDLNSLMGYKKFLFNVYVPTSNNGTTEIDVILLHESGIYVFESKNYSGWIFGTETYQYWVQTLPMGRGATQKNRFYNPIWQNRTHIKYLRRFLNDYNPPFYSYVVFSNRCLLKDITLTTKKLYNPTNSRYHCIYTINCYQCVTNKN